MRDNWTSAPLRVLAIKTLGGDWGKDELEAPANSVATTVIRGSEFRNWTTERAGSAPTRWLRPESLERRRLAEGDLVIEVSGGGPSQPVGRSLVIDAEALSSTSSPLVCTNFCRQIRLAPGAVPRFVDLALKTHYASGAIEAIQTNTTNLRNLTFESFLDLEIPLPPVAEQRRIADKVDALAAHSRRAKESLAAVPPLLDKLRQSILAAAFRGDLTADWRAKNPDVEPADKLLSRVGDNHRSEWEQGERAKLTAKGRLTSDNRWRDKYEAPTLPGDVTLDELPATWRWAPLDLIRAGDAAMVYGIILPGEHVPGGVPYVRPIDIDPSGKIKQAELKRTSAEIADQYARASLRAGDIVLSIVGTIGKVAVTPPELDGANITQSSVRIRPGSGTAPDFLTWALQAPCLTRQYDNFRFGNAVQRLNIEHVRQLVVPLPPLAEQREICVRIASSMERLLALDVPSIASRLAALESSVLAKAFRGDLVPQDPNDEPAAMLLDRVSNALRNADATPRPRATRKPPPTAGRAPLEPPAPPNSESQPGLDAAALVEHAVGALWLHGPRDKDAAIRRLADHLRDVGLVSFQRLRADGPLYAQLSDAIDAAVKTGHLDRPKRGQVRACKRDATAYTADDWRHALLAVLGPSATDRDEAIRAAAEWARDNCGLEFTRLRADGHIVTGIRSALNSAIRAKLITRIDATRIARAPEPLPKGQLSFTDLSPTGRGEPR